MGSTTKEDGGLRQIEPGWLDRSLAHAELRAMSAEEAYEAGRRSVVVSPADGEEIKAALKRVSQYVGFAETALDHDLRILLARHVALRAALETIADDDQAQFGKVYADGRWQEVGTFARAALGAA